MWFLLHFKMQFLWITLVILLWMKPKVASKPSTHWPQVCLLGSHRFYLCLFIFFKNLRTAILSCLFLLPSIVLSCSCSPAEWPEDLLQWQGPSGDEDPKYALPHFTALLRVFAHSLISSNSHEWVTLCSAIPTLTAIIYLNVSGSTLILNIFSSATGLHAKLWV